MQASIPRQVRHIKKVDASARRGQKTTMRFLGIESVQKNHKLEDPAAVSPTGRLIAATRTTVTGANKDSANVDPAVSSCSTHFSSKTKQITLRR